MPGRLEGKVALITGGGRGIGRAIAQRFAREGALVAVCGRTSVPLEDTARSIDAAGGQALAITCDVTRKAEIEKAVGAVLARFGRLDILIHNAGVGAAIALADLTEAHYDSVMGTNVAAAFWLTRCAVPHLPRGGRILFTSSTLGTISAMARLAAYSASRGAIRGFVRSAALELAPSGITVNIVECGSIQKDIAAPAYEASMSKVVPLGRLGRQDEVAGAMLFLASEDGGYVTGTQLVIDGGLSLPSIATTMAPQIIARPDAPKS
jgi:3-oxoacyl-[acyl-carrier protein] reductase